MNKVKVIGWILLGTGLAILFLTVFMPVLTETASSANLSIASTSNWTDYPGSQAALVGAPWWLYFIPPVLGLIAIVVVLKRKSNDSG